jgi:hypothetical protein
MRTTLDSLVAKSSEVGNGVSQLCEEWTIARPWVPDPLQPAMHALRAAAYRSVLVRIRPV